VREVGEANGTAALPFVAEWKGSGGGGELDGGGVINAPEVPSAALVRVGFIVVERRTGEEEEGGGSVDPGAGSGLVRGWRPERPVAEAVRLGSLTVMPEPPLGLGVGLLVGESKGGGGGYSSDVGAKEVVAEGCLVRGCLVGGMRVAPFCGERVGREGAATGAMSKVGRMGPATGVISSVGGGIGTLGGGGRLPCNNPAWNCMTSISVCGFAAISA